MKPTPDMNAIWNLRDFIAAGEDPNRALDLRIHATLHDLSPYQNEQEVTRMLKGTGIYADLPEYTTDESAAKLMLKELFDGCQLYFGTMSGDALEDATVTPYHQGAPLEKGVGSAKTEVLALIIAGFDAYLKNADTVQPKETRPSERIKRLSSDCGFLLGMIKTLEEATGEGPEDEDAAIVGAIRADLEADGQPITRPQTAIEDLVARNKRLSAILDERFNETALVEFQNGQIVLENGPVPYFAAYLAEMLTRPDGTQSNYAQMEFQHNALGPMTLTLQRVSGKTAHELRREAELARDDVILALHDAINRPKGVVPASAEPFYDPHLAARASSTA